MSEMNRQKDRPLTDHEKQAIQNIKIVAGHFLAALQDAEFAAADPRCLAIARTKIEEAVMWITKGINA